MSHHSTASTTAEVCKIEMLWNWNTIDACFLSQSWYIANNSMFAASCIGVVLLVVCLEALRRMGREYEQWITKGWQRRAAALGAEKGCCQPVEVPVPGIQNQTSTVGRLVTFRATPLQQFIRAVIHAVTFGVAYLVMLLVMSYNGYIIVCVIIGAGLGKFLCDWMTRRIVVGTGAEAPVMQLDEPTVCCG